MVLVTIEFVGDPRRDSRIVMLSRVPCIGELVDIEDEALEVRTVFHHMIKSDTQLAAIVRVK